MPEPTNQPRAQTPTNKAGEPYKLLQLNSDDIHITSCSEVDAPMRALEKLAGTKIGLMSGKNPPLFAMEVDISDILENNRTLVKELCRGMNFSPNEVEVKAIVGREGRLEVRFFGKNVPDRDPYLAKAYIDQRVDKCNYVLTEFTPLGVRFQTLTTNPSGNYEICALKEATRTPKPITVGLDVRSDSHRAIDGGFKQLPRFDQLPIKFTGLNNPVRIIYSGEPPDVIVKDKDGSFLLKQNSLPTKTITVTQVNYPEIYANLLSIFSAAGEAVLDPKSVVAIERKELNGRTIYQLQCNTEFAVTPRIRELNKEQNSKTHALLAACEQAGVRGLVCFNGPKHGHIEASGLGGRKIFLTEDEIKSGVAAIESQDGLKALEEILEKYKNYQALLQTTKLPQAELDTGNLLLIQSVTKNNPDTSWNVHPFVMELDKRLYPIKPNPNMALDGDPTIRVSRFIRADGSSGLTSKDLPQFFGLVREAAKKVGITLETSIPDHQLLPALNQALLNGTASGFKSNIALVLEEHQVPGSTDNDIAVKIRMTRDCMPKLIGEFPKGTQSVYLFATDGELILAIARPNSTPTQLCPENALIKFPDNQHALVVELAAFSAIGNNIQGGSRDEILSMWYYNTAASLLYDQFVTSHPNLKNKTDNNHRAAFADLISLKSSQRWALEARRILLHDGRTGNLTMSKEALTAAIKKVTGQTDIDQTIQLALNDPHLNAALLKESIAALENLFQ